MMPGKISEEATTTAILVRCPAVMFVPLALSAAIFRPLGRPGITVTSLVIASKMSFGMPAV